MRWYPLHGIFRASKHEIIATLEQYARDRILAIEILASTNSASDHRSSLTTAVLV
jgi:hypothetical protein